MKAMLVLLAGTLAACQSWEARAPDRTPPPRMDADADAGSSGSSGATGSSSAGATASGTAEKAGVGSWYGMCEMRQRIMNARTPEERQALMEKMMPNMAQESRERHLGMMQHSCQQ